MSLSISPHCHPESPLTGSTVAAMVARAKQLGRTHFAYTDLGHLSSCLKAYGLCKPDKRKIEDLAKTNEQYLKNPLRFAPGIEFYFKDATCDLVNGTPADRCRYFTGTIYATNQTAYQELCRVVSQTGMPQTTIQDESQSLWSWAELERLGKSDTLFVAGGIHCMIGKVLLADGRELAEKILCKLNGIFGKRLFLSVICEPWDRKYASVVKIRYTDGTHDSILASDSVSTDRARKMKASDLVHRSGHSQILSKTVHSTFFEVNKKIAQVTEHKGFLPLPGGDVTLRINQFLLEMGRKYQIAVVASDYAFYAEKDDHIVQTMVLEGKNKLKSNLHMKTDEEFYSYLYNVMKLSQEEAVRIMSDNDTFAHSFDGLELKYEWRLADSGSVPALQQCMDIIKKNGRMKWENPEYVSRLREEIQVIAKNPKKDMCGYFLPIVEVLDFYKKNGYLTSIGRGSAGGSLFCFLLEITHIDPIRWNLPFSRFFSLDRIMNNKLPDIDVDLPDKTPLISKDGKGGFLYERWGNRACQVSSRSRVRLKSSIKDTNRYLNGSVQKDIEILTKSLPQPPQNTDDHDFVFGYNDEEGNHVSGLIETSEALRKYSTDRPKEFSIIQKAMGITRAFSVHACATLISDIPISDVLPTKRGTICQYEYKEAEEAGLIKFDFLTVNQLMDIQECIKLINKKNNDPIDAMYFKHDGERVFVWDLPQLPEVYKSVWGGQTKTLFQIHTPGMAKFTQELLPENMWDLSAILALQRPGPLDYILEESGRNMAEEYIFRRNGKSKSDIPELAALLPETYGIICYQEDLNKIARTIAGMDGETAEKLRENMAKKKMKELEKMKPVFIQGASKKLSLETAEAVWDQMVTFGRYGFSSIHSAEYSHYTYATMFLRHLYPLEWYASILTNATEREISGILWSTVKDYLAAPDINLSSDKMEIDYANHKIRPKLGIVRGIGSATIDPIVAGRPYKDIRDFIEKDVAGESLSRKLIHVGVLDSLFPPKLSFLEKLQIFEDAIEVRNYNLKVQKAKEDGKLLRQTEPRKGEIPEQYLNIEKNPMENAARKKSVLPSLLVGLHDLGRNHSKCVVGRAYPSKIMTDSYNHEVILITGEMLQRLDEMDGHDKDKYVAITAFIVETKVFDYKNNTKQALKVILDADSYINEKVLWPDYLSGSLIYPPELKKGNICTVFLKKRASKNDGTIDPCSITEIVIEA